MSISDIAIQTTEMAPHYLAWVGSYADQLNLGAQHAATTATTTGGHGAGAELLRYAQAATTATDAGGGPSYADQVQGLAQEEQFSWLTSIGKHFIGVFQKGGETFAGFVTGIIPTLIVLMTAFYALTEMVGEQRVHGFARFAGRIALTRYTILPVLAMFFLTNPMAYTFGTFLEEKHKPAFYDSAVSFCHPILGLFPHANPGEYFVWGGVLVAIQQLEAVGTVSSGYHVRLAMFYFGVGVIVILLRGIVTEYITRLMASRQKIEL
ncbi:PTS glucitol/sorbitol transporter subunit IIC [Paracoccus pacificus]|uniref:PTS glucitol/sorbitol transporter subunit IIC n=1 Tax=Paracoccus pacificus TaxID=1463598 RepID=A0ABW4R5H5_9RHOB